MKDAPPPLGTAAAQVDRELLEQSAAGPWKDIVRMRNRLIHAYHGIGLGGVWDTITVTCPPKGTSES